MVRHREVLSEFDVVAVDSPAAGTCYGQLRLTRHTESRDVGRGLYKEAVCGTECTAFPLPSRPPSDHPDFALQHIIP
jgi:hypothetical protein